MPALVHKIGGAIAFATIAIFWISTVVAELAFDAATVTLVKTAIPYGFLLLIPALIATGVSGLRLAKGRRGGVLGAKLRRMPVIAANGLFVLVPAALFLAARAQAGTFDAAFYAVQALELTAGAINLSLMSLNIRDGLRMTARRRRQHA